MRNAAYTLLLFLLVGSSPLRSDDDQNALTQVKELEDRLLAIKKESADIPVEELDKASEWVEDAKNPRNPELGSLILKKASCQIDYLDALLEESKSRRKADEMEELLRKIKSQTEEIKNTNAEVKEEINSLEQK